MDVGLFDGPTSVSRATGRNVAEPSPALNSHRPCTHRSESSRWSWSSSPVWPAPPAEAATASRRTALRRRPASPPTAPSSLSRWPSKALKLELTGPTAQTRPTGTSCVFTGKTPAGRTSTETVLFNGNEDKASFDIVRQGYKENKIKVNKIGGWGDEAYAVRLMLFIPQNTFSVREGRVSVTITSAADFEEVRALMKEILKKIS